MTAKDAAEQGYVLLVMEPEYVRLADEAKFKPSMYIFNPSEDEGFNVVRHERA